jgi:hypothetical protein
MDAYSSFTGRFARESGQHESSRLALLPYDLDALPDCTLLKRDEVASWLRLSTATLERWAAKARGPPITRVDGRPRYRLGDLRAWLSAQ